ncbi:MAG: 2,3-bisphosphoglycerate-independent phosphoglycerate mutase [Bacteroidia bacterium]
MQKPQKTALIILDGWGHGPDNPKINAIRKAHTPFVDSLYLNYPHAELKTYGESAGLPAGQMGNSEVGHLNIGAGRIVHQQLVRINMAFRKDEVYHNPVVTKAFQDALQQKKKVHLIGLVSAGGVHSHINHLIALCELAHRAGLRDVFIHAFTDGRDTGTHEALEHLQKIQEECRKTTGQIASVTGRYYAMDRDKRWERTKLAYDMMVHGKGQSFTDPIEAIRESYDQGITDEFIKPVVIVKEDGSPVATISDGDVVINFNFRTDRGRQISEALTQRDFPEHNMQKLNLHYLTFTEYDATFKNVEVIFENKNIENTLGEVLEKAGKTQMRIAETEKYPHVTFFFSGGREDEFEGEFRRMIPSTKVATYDLQPEMNAEEVTRQAIESIEQKAPDFVCLNFANPDMVGHTGVFDAVVKALETIDDCLKKVVSACIKNDYAVIVTADHGNADFLVNEDGTSNTAHTKNPVPVFLINYKGEARLRDGILADLAPTVLEIMQISQPNEMTGKSLLTKN